MVLIRCLASFFGSICEASGMGVAQGFKGVCGPVAQIWKPTRRLDLGDETNLRNSQGFRWCWSGNLKQSLLQKSLDMIPNGASLDRLCLRDISSKKAGIAVIRLLLTA